MKYAVESYYDYRHDPQIDYVSIYHADEYAIEHDGFDLVGREDAFRINCYDNLEEAIEKAGYWPSKIIYGSDFSKEEKDIVVKTVNKLVRDKEFCDKYNTLPVKVFEFSKKDIKTEENTSMYMYVHEDEAEMEMGN